MSGGIGQSQVDGNKRIVMGNMMGKRNEVQVKNRQMVKKKKRNGKYDPKKK